MWAISRIRFLTLPDELGKGILVTPTVDSNLLLGPTAEDQEDREDTSTTAQGLQSVQANARKVVPSVNLRGVITAFAGLRAVGDTGDFILKSPRQGFWNAAGIESPGLSSAPAIAEYIIEGMREQGLELIEKAQFNPCRKALHDFSAMSIEEKNHVIQKNPLYGHIICRCESISEGEIVEAIRQNPAGQGPGWCEAQDESRNGPLPGRLLRSDGDRDSGQRVECADRTDHKIRWKVLSECGTYQRGERLCR